MMRAISDKEDKWIDLTRRYPSLSETIDKLVEEYTNKSSQPNRRFMVSSSTGSLDCSVDTDLRETGVTLNSYIITKKTEPYPEEYGSLHIMVPNRTMEGIIRLRFHFRDINRHELPFTYIESYDQDDEQGRPCDVYYFLPAPEAKLSERYPFSRVITRAFPVDATTADVVILVD